MNRVAPERRESSFRPSVASAERVRHSCAPCVVGTARRGRSVGSSRTSRGPFTAPSSRRSGSRESSRRARRAATWRNPRSGTVDRGAEEVFPSRTPGREPRAHGGRLLATSHQLCGASSRSGCGRCAPQPQEDRADERAASQVEWGLRLLLDEPIRAASPPPLGEVLDVDDRQVEVFAVGDGLDGGAIDRGEAAPEGLVSLDDLPQAPLQCGARRSPRNRIASQRL